MKEAQTVFYSWQLDTPSVNGRGFIERCLESALSKINQEIQVVEPERELLALDKDTMGVPGQPPIVDTTFGKIDHASVFVPDLTFIANRRDGRPSPNPNVLIEYGWALNSLGHGRVVPLMNTAYGKPDGDSLPFDMRHLRWPLCYHLAETATDEEREEVASGLTSALQAALKAVLGNESAGPDASREPFVPTEAMSGQARFRAPGVPLGVEDNLSFLKPAKDVFMADGSAVWLRVMPTRKIDKTWPAIEIKQKVTQGGRILFMPLLSGYSSLGFLRADDGFGVYAVAAETKTPAVTFGFESGEVWSVDSYLIPALRNHSTTFKAEAALPITHLMQGFEESLRYLKEYFALLKVDQPLRWIAGVEGVKGMSLAMGRSSIPSSGHCVSEVISEKGASMPDQSPKESLRPFFEKVCSKFGVHPSVLYPS